MTIEHKHTRLRLRWKRAIAQWRREQELGEQLARHLGMGPRTPETKERPN